MWIESQTELPARKKIKLVAGVCAEGVRTILKPPPPVLGVSWERLRRPGFGFDPDVLDLNSRGRRPEKKGRRGTAASPSPDPGGRGPGNRMERPSRRGGASRPRLERQAGRQRAPAASLFPARPPGRLRPRVSTGAPPSGRPARRRASRSRGRAGRPRVRARGPGERARAGGRGPRGPTSAALGYTIAEPAPRARGRGRGGGAGVCELRARAEPSPRVTALGAAPGSAGRGPRESRAGGGGGGRREREGPGPGPVAAAPGSPRGSGVRGWGRGRSLRPTGPGAARAAPTTCSTTPGKFPAAAPGAPRLRSPAAAGPAEGGARPLRAPPFPGPPAAPPGSHAHPVALRPAPASAHLLPRSRAPPLSFSL